MRIALAHDWLVGYRGGEAVLDAITRVVRDAGHEISALYTMFDDGRPLTPSIDAIPKRVSVVSRLEAVRPGARRWLLPVYPLAVAELSRTLARDHRVSPIDMLISTSSAAIKGLRPPAGVPHVCYCHSPARYLWDMQDEYGATAPEGLRGRLRGIGLRVLGPSLRRWDARTAGVLRVTTFLANSTCTQERIARCYRRESTIVFPPVRTGFFTPDASVAREDFWLVAGAIEPYKRTDLAIHAAALTRQRVIVVGDGSQRAVMERLARERGGPIEFMGRVDDDALRGFYRRARGLLFPQIEDFGITACEAQACGTPVVARRAGGALDTVIDGVTGAMFDHPTAESMAEAMGRCPETRAACRKKAEQFSAERFSAGLNEMILRLSR